MRQEFKGTIRWLGEVYLDQMASFSNVLISENHPSHHPTLAQWTPQSLRHMDSPLWVGMWFLHLLWGCVSYLDQLRVVVGQNVVVVVARFFHFFGEYAFIFHHFGERARPKTSESIQDDQAKEHSGSIGTRIQRALMLTCDSFLNSFITLPKSPCLNPR